MKRSSVIISLFTGLVLLGSASYVLFAQENCTQISIKNWNGCRPVVETGGVTSTDKYSAVVQAYYSSQGGSYSSSNRPALAIEFGLEDDGIFDRVTVSSNQMQGARTEAFLLNGLTEGKTYMYRAVLNWAGGIEYGNIKLVTPNVKKLGSGGSNTATDIPSNSTSSTGTNSSGNNSTSTGNSSNNSTGSSSNQGVSFSPFGNLFGNKTNTTTKKSIYSQTDEKSGFKLAIDNGESLIRQGDVITTKVRYENNNSKSYSNAQIELFFPKEYSVDSTNKGIVDRANNKVVVSVDDFPAGGYGTIIATARATGRLGNIDQVLTQATLTVGSVRLSVTDADEYGEGTARKTQNSVSGTGFVPGTLIGWILLLIVLALIVVIGRRYFIKKDY